MTEYILSVYISSWLLIPVTRLPQLTGVRIPKGKSNGRLFFSFFFLFFFFRGVIKYRVSEGLVTRVGGGGGKLEIEKLREVKKRLRMAVAAKPQIRQSGEPG